MASEFVSYLKNLRFDPKLLRSFHAKYIQNIRIVILLIIAIIAIGTLSLLNLPRRLNPEIKLTIVRVSAVLPGAGPQDVESLVTIPLEDKLTGVKGIDTIISVSQDNFSLIVMQFLSGVDKDKARSDAQTAVSEVTTLPTDAQTPKVEALDFEDQPIWSFSLTSKNDYASLMRFADSFRTELERQTDIDRVVLTGLDNQQIQVVLDPQKIRDFNLNPLQVSQALKNATNSFPAGSVYTGSFNFSLSIDSEVATVEDIRNMHMNISGQPLKLGDVAVVSQKSEPNQRKSYLATSQIEETPSVTFFVYKSTSADIVKTVKNIEKFVHDRIDQTNGNYAITTQTNAGEEIGRQFTDLIGEFRSTLILVFINLLLFLGVRQALIANMTIPLTFLMSFGWMAIFGETLNFLTLFALLLAFGTSIDDTIVTVSAMTAYYRTNKFSPIETGLLVWRDFIVPIWTTTVTTVWAFLPLLLTTGIIGEFIKPIPVVVATTMYTSTAVTWFITLPMMIVLLKPQVPRRVKILFGILAVLAVVGAVVALSPKNLFLVPIFIIMVLFLYTAKRTVGSVVSQISHILGKNKMISKTAGLVKSIFSHGLINTERLSGKYKDLILRILNSKRGRRVVLVCLGAFALTAYLLVPAGLVKNEFFPKTNSDTLFMSLEMPSGTNIATVDRETLAILKKLRETPETKAVVAETGTAIASNGNQSASDNSSLFTIILIPKEERRTQSSDIASKLRDEFALYRTGKISVFEESSGPPAGADVQIKLLGDDLGVLDTYSGKLMDFLKTQSGVINVDKSIKSGTSKLVFVPDKAKIAAAGLTTDQLGFWLRLSASGFKLDSVRFNNKDEDVVFYNNGGTLSPENIGNIAIPTTTGTQVPLVTLGSFTLKNNPTVITREGGKRTMSVSAGVVAGYSISEINKNLTQFATTKLNLPPGYEWKTGGVNEENAKSVASIFRAMFFSFILIMATMVVEFKSYRQAAMILSLIPIAVSGVFIIFGLTGTPLSFPALIGVLALFGVVVTNAMFIVEKINQNRTHGMDLDHAIADAAQSRLEPIMLTSLTSILGLVPITLANALWRGLGGAIISGLMFSGIIMLFYIPVMYYTLYRSEENK